MPAEMSARTRRSIALNSLRNGIAALFEGKSRDEQKALLSNLERRGAVLYRVLSLYVSWDGEGKAPRRAQQAAI